MYVLCVKITIYSAFICVPPVLLLPLLLNPFHHTRDLHTLMERRPCGISTCRSVFLALFGRCQSNRPAPSVRYRYWRGRGCQPIDSLEAPNRPRPPREPPFTSSSTIHPTPPHNPPHYLTSPTSPAASASSRRTCPSTRRSARRSGLRGCARGSAAPRARI